MSEDLPTSEELIDFIISKIPLSVKEKLKKGDSYFDSDGDLIMCGLEENFNVLYGHLKPICSLKKAETMIGTCITNGIMDMEGSKKIVKPPLLNCLFYKRFSVLFEEEK